jgi:tRNA(Ile)-lysidine synthase
LRVEQVFSAALAALLPLGLPPRLALGVSGGADSTALALLAHEYCRSRRGAVLALIADHGLRPEAGREARLTAGRLAERGIPSRILPLGLSPGSGLQHRARQARQTALGQAAAAGGFLYLALGHHSADQEETVAMRARRGPGGGEGMPGWAARGEVVLLRPLLGVAPAALRGYLLSRGMRWVEDPSNESRAFERVRIRQDGEGIPPAGPAARQEQEEEAASFLAARAQLFPEGYAVLDAESAPPAALAAVIRTIGGGLYPPRRAAVRRLAAGLRPATLGGVRILPAGRLGPGWLLAREPAACAAPVEAACHARWDDRFTLVEEVPEGLSLGALGDDSARVPPFNGLPRLILRALPALRGEGGGLRFPAPARFEPRLPAAPRPFQP